MAFLIADQDRVALRPGRNTLGGRGADAVALTSLAGLAPAAVITVRPDGTALIQRISAAVIVKVDGGPLGAMPHPLANGARVAIGPIRLTYSEAPPERETERRGSDVAGSSDSAEKPGTPTEVIEVMSAPVVGGRLIELGTGCVYPVPRDGLIIGRGAECDIVVDDPGVSRRHAIVKPGRGGFIVTDESANGTFVNGARLTGAQTLRHGDVLGVGTEEFRIDVDATPFASVFQTPSTAQVELVSGIGDPDPLSLISSRRAPERPAPPPPSPMLTPVPLPLAALALLEVTRGPFAGKTFRIERPVCAIGRGNHNDVRLNDASVSSSHATLLLKRGTWYAVDLQSANGTYVDGYRVATERALPDGASLHIGDIVMRFRLMSAHREAPSATRGAGGIWRRIRRLWAS